ncbi:glutaredoxin family protein [Caldimonas thermodepolymerans]|jgi:glutaredoxin|uniref:Glutaredoxin n=1 Tax=Caldimonas thermodepolymerans TaxID=215580 RepID=A0A2S5T4I9_9BURK|nr:glutaredoxin family protein [Caldimonas thermodepolymerans]PPE69849.1 NrdH-redoxin [Caldimonas thermodepolymerans]QPC32682.1 glutaredoxin family protein [Caldimonas thermodepolymerans]RDI03439.1 glutaredoxin [Caldimonas thermodepolymerans]TCP06702.1 glutaredoxin [Caldimonas thermodepolymerans]UZG45490.1 glutaredoxin family protein [Caldimonas thermodepolymerans]
MNARARRLAGLLVLGVAVLGLSQLAARWQAGRLGAQAARAQPGDIVMYTTTDCPYCAQARAWFGRHGVPYAECNTTVDAACRAVFQALASPGVPTLVVRGERQVGFQPERVVQALQR